MPRNRGKHPNDDLLFSKKWLPIFTEANIDVTYLLSRDYGAKATLELVGNRYRLNKRQRMALSRMVASTQQVQARNEKALHSSDLAEQVVEIDGFNLLILLESALSGAYIFHAQDNTYRDIGSVHGSYKQVVKTEEAIVIVGKILEELKVKQVRWLLDQPISNSGRLKTFLYQISTKYDWNWEVELTFSPDKELAVSQNIVISSDSWILDETDKWFNMGAYLIDNELITANVFR